MPTAPLAKSTSKARKQTKGKKTTESDVESTVAAPVPVLSKSAASKKPASKARVPSEKPSSSTTSTTMDVDEPKKKSAAPASKTRGGSAAAAKKPPSTSNTLLRARGPSPEPQAERLEVLQEQEHEVGGEEVPDRLEEVMDMQVDDEMDAEGSQAPIIVGNRLERIVQESEMAAMAELFTAHAVQCMSIDRT